jgi:hypothetical protein
MAWLAGAALDWPLLQQRLEDVGRIGFEAATKPIETPIEIAFHADGIPDAREEHDDDHGQERSDDHNELGHFNLPAVSDADRGTRTGR